MSFTPQILTVNHERIKSVIDEYKQRTDEVNQSLEKINDFLELTLTDEEIKDLINSGQNLFDTKIKKPFPDADLDFNLQSVGKVNQYHDALEELEKITSLRYQKYITPENGKFIFSEKAEKQIRESCTVRTINQKQNEVLKMAKDVCKVMNEAVAKGYYSFTPYAGLSSIPFIREANEAGAKGFIPNVSHIREIT